MLLRSDSESVSNFRPERLTFIFKQPLIHFLEGLGVKNEMDWGVVVVDLPENVYIWGQYACGNSDIHS